MHELGHAIGTAFAFLLYTAIAGVAFMMVASVLLVAAWFAPLPGWSIAVPFATAAIAWFIAYRVIR